MSCDGIDPKRNDYNNRSLGAASDIANCLSKCAASAGCIVVAFISSGNC